MNNLKNTQAFTLIEVLGSITILGIVLTIFLSFFSNATLFSSKTEDKLTAINYADAALHNVKSILTLTATSDTAICGTGVDNLEQKTFQLNNKTYHSQVTGCREIYNNNGTTEKLDLFRLHVEILSANNKSITDLYDYYVIK